MPWVNGFFEIDLDSVPTPELDPDWSTSHGYTRAEMEKWLDDLQEIERLRAEGRTAGDFRAMLDSHDPRLHSLGRTYYNFYENQESGRLNFDHVKVEWLGDRYDITNGQHRVWLAKQRGMTHIPALVSAPDERTLEVLQARSDAARTRIPLWERPVDNHPFRDERLR